MARVERGLGRRSFLGRCLSVTVVICSIEHLPGRGDEARNKEGQECAGRVPRPSTTRFREPSGASSATGPGGLLRRVAGSHRVGCIPIAAPSLPREAARQWENLPRALPRGYASGVRAIPLHHGACSSRGRLSAPRPGRLASSWWQARRAIRSSTSGRDKRQSCSTMSFATFSPGECQSNCQSDASDIHLLDAGSGDDHRPKMLTLGPL